VVPVTAVIFDLGKVLVDFDHRISCRKIALLAGRSSQEIYESFFENALIKSFEEGKISPPSFYQAVRRLIDIDIPFEQFSLIWNGIFYLTDENKAAYALLKTLSSRYTLALLSNINELHYAYLKAAVPVFDCFQHLFASCEMGVTKPDPLIYKKALAVLGVEPPQVFYTDDRPEMVAAACALGIRGFVYTGSVQLRNDLALCGISTEA
jgi:FMN phosphatase YigB (HAD superfamily)